jgi:hypothetical protein
MPALERAEDGPRPGEISGPIALAGRRLAVRGEPEYDSLRKWCGRNPGTELAQRLGQLAGADLEALVREWAANKRALKRQRLEYSSTITRTNTVAEDIAGKTWLQLVAMYGEAAGRRAEAMTSYPDPHLHPDEDPKLRENRRYFYVSHGARQQTDSSRSLKRRVSGADTAEGSTAGGLEAQVDGPACASDGVPMGQLAVAGPSKPRPKAKGKATARAAAVAAPPEAKAAKASLRKLATAAEAWVATREELEDRKAMAGKLNVLVKRAKKTLANDEVSKEAVLNEVETLMTRMQECGLKVPARLPHHAA